MEDVETGKMQKGGEEALSEEEATKLQEELQQQLNKLPFFISGIPDVEPALDILNDDEFREANGYGWDYCLVLPYIPKEIEEQSKDDNDAPEGPVDKLVDEGGEGRQKTKEEEDRERAMEIVSKIIKSGCETFNYLNSSRDQLFVLIRCPLDVVEKFADVKDITIQLDPDECKSRLEAGNDKFHIAPREINDDPYFTPWSPYQDIYGRYDVREDLQKLYKVEKEEKIPFRNGERLRIILDILSTREESHGADLSVWKMLKRREISAFFPMHDESTAEELLKSIMKLRWRLWKMPFDEIKNYLGEKITLYFRFLSHYTSWLLPIAVAGLAIQILISLDIISREGYVAAGFSVVVALWAVIMVETWKRTEAVVVFRWGMNDFLEEEVERPEFRGREITSFIDGSSYFYYSTFRRLTAYTVSISVVTSMIVMVFGAVAGIFIIRNFLFQAQDSPIPPDQVALVAAVVNAIQIQIFNFIYKKVAIFLTDFENQRTDTQYQNSLILKLFVFQFMNSFVSFIYLAFIAEIFDQPCGADETVSCYDALFVQLATIFVVQIFVGNSIEVILPAITRILKGIFGKRGKNAGILNDHISAAELEYRRSRYDPMLGLIQDYAELAIQFGFVTLFVSAFPLAPLLAFVSNLIEIRSDSFKFLHELQRPMPYGVQNIGSWHGVFRTISILAVISNGALIAFVMNETVLADEETEEKWRVWAFNIFQYAVIGAQIIIALLIPDIPKKVQIQAAREQFLRDKLIDNTRDDKSPDLPKIEMKHMPILTDYRWAVKNSFFRDEVAKSGFLSTAFNLIPGTEIITLTASKMVGGVSEVVGAVGELATSGSFHSKRKEKDSAESPDDEGAKDDGEGKTD